MAGWITAEAAKQASYLLMSALEKRLGNILCKQGAKSASPSQIEALVKGGEAHIWQK